MHYFDLGVSGTKPGDVYEFVISSTDGYGGATETTLASVPPLVVPPPPPPPPPMVRRRSSSACTASRFAMPQSRPKSAPWQTSRRSG